MDSINEIENQEELPQIITNPKLSFLPIALFFIIISSLVIMKVISQKSHNNRSIYNIFDQLNYSGNSHPSPTEPIYLVPTANRVKNTPNAIEGSIPINSNPKTTDPNEIILFTGGILGVDFDFTR